MRSSFIFLSFKKKSLASTVMIKISAKMRNVILTNSIPLKLRPAKPIKPVNAVRTKNSIV